MTYETWLLYVATVLVFMSTPGPSHLLMLSVSATNGFHRSIATATGDLTANVIQIILAGFGLATLITSSRYGFAIVKWGGVAYLLWIGARQILQSFRQSDSTAAAPVASLRSLWLRGFVTSASNPKAVVFFAALFPQFLNAQSALAPQIAILGLTYVTIDGVILSAYGKGGSWLAERLRGRHRAWIDRAAGAGIIGTAAILGLRASRQS